MLGFETFYALKNFGSLILVVLGTFISALLTSILLLIPNKKIKKFVGKFHQKIFFNGFIMFLYETFILFAMAGAIGT